MNPVPEIYKRLKIGLAIAVGFGAGKLAAAHWGGAYASEAFSAGFLAGVIGAQGLFKLLELWRRGKPSPSA
jgi:hypothetical protein